MKRQTQWLIRLARAFRSAKPETRKLAAENIRRTRRMVSHRAARLFPPRAKEVTP